MQNCDIFNHMIRVTYNLKYENKTINEKIIALIENKTFYMKI